MSRAVNIKLSDARVFSRIDVGLSDWPLQQQLLAIKALNQNTFHQHMPEGLPKSTPSKAPGVTSEARHYGRQTILSGTALRDKLLRAFQEEFTPYDSTSPAVNAAVHAVVPAITDLKPTDVDAIAMPLFQAGQPPGGILCRNQMIQSWTKRHRAALPLPMEGDPDLDLNTSQTKAMAMMLSERLSLVQGVSLPAFRCTMADFCIQPPGTASRNPCRYCQLTVHRARPVSSSRRSSFSNSIGRSPFRSSSARTPTSP